MAAGGTQAGEREGRAVWGLQLPAMPEERGGQVIVDRGGRESIAMQRPEGQLGYDEQVTGIPELQGNSLADMAKWAVDLEARGLGKASDIIARYAAAQQHNQTQMGLGELRFDESDMTSGRQMQNTQATVAGGVQQANIAADANRDVANLRGPGTVSDEEPVRNADGSVVYGATKKRAFAWNPQTEQWGPMPGAGEAAQQPQYYPPKRYNEFLQGLIDGKNYTAGQAREYATKLGIFPRKEN